MEAKHIIAKNNVSYTKVVSFPKRKEKKLKAFPNT